MALGWVSWRAWLPLVARGAAALCGAGVALGDIDVPLRGRCGTCRHLLAFGVALAATSTLPFFICLAWHAWHFWRWAGSGSALWHLATSTFHLRGRRGPWAHPPWFRVAGVALMALGSALSHVALSDRKLFHKPLFHTHTTLSYVQLWHTELFHRHLLCLSFLPRPASTSVSNYWKKLTFGVIRSFFWFSHSFWQFLPHGV